MAWRLSILAGIFLCSGSTGCLLYTDPINVAPTVSIVSPPELARGIPLPFSADARDDQRSPLRYLWGLGPGPCPAGDGLPPDPPSMSGAAPTFAPIIDGAGDYCVWVTVSDDFNAQAHATHGFRVDDRTPAAVISRLAPAGGPSAAVPLYSDLRFTGRDSSDPDPGDTLTSSWTLVAPGAQPVSPAACGDAPDEICFAAESPGLYALTLTVRDGDGLMASQLLSIDVATDQPPCIVDTDPPFLVARLIRDPAADLTLTVVGVDDDGDPLPALTSRPSQASFAWSWRIGPSAAFTRMADFDRPSYLFPGGTFLSGETLQVRAEAHDRQGRSAGLAACDLTQPLLCEVAAGCDQWVTWTVEFR